MWRYVGVGDFNDEFGGKEGAGCGGGGTGGGGDVGGDWEPGSVTSQRLVTLLDTMKIFERRDFSIIFV